MASGRTVVAIAALVGVLAASGGIAAGMMTAPTPIPDVIALPPGPGIVDVTPREFDDLRTVAATSKLSKSSDYTTQAAGIVRGSACKLGLKIVSGDSLLTVDGLPIVALHLDKPLWRTLERGVRGDDVADLQRELRRLGFAPRSVPDAKNEGVYSAATATQVAALWKSVGVDKQSDMPADRIIWLPSKSATVATCPVAVGAQITPGSVVFTTGGKLQSLALTLPEETQRGKRIAVLDETTAPIDDGGKIVDPAFLAAFEKSWTYKQWLEDSSAARLTVESHLTTATTVVAIPPSALYSVVPGSACVVSEGKPVAVQIVASELGQTFITADPLPRQVAVPAPIGAAPCA